MYPNVTSARSCNTVACFDLQFWRSTRPMTSFFIFIAYINTEGILFNIKMASVEKQQVFYYLVSDAKIFDISPGVTLPFPGRQTVRSHSNKGDNCICIIKFANDMRQVGGFLRTLRFPPPIKVTATI